MNAADYINSEQDEHGTKDEDRVLDHLRTIAGWGMVDLIEVSGGDYEKPGMSPKSALLGRYSHLSSLCKTLCKTLQVQHHQDRVSFLDSLGQP